MANQAHLPYTLFAGVDSAAATATIVWQCGDDIPSCPATFVQTPAGMQAFQAHLILTGAVPAQTLVVMKVTGNDWMTLATTLHAAGYPHGDVRLPLAG